MNIETEKHEYIPSSITLSWATDGKTFNCINKHSVSCYLSPVDEEFSELFVNDCGRDIEYDDQIFIPEVLSSLDDIASIDSESIEERKSAFALIFSSQYFFNRYSIGAKTLFTLNNLDKIKGMNYDDFVNLAAEEVMRTRNLSDRIQAEFMAVKASLFFMDLKCVMLQAPPSSPLILGNRPFIGLNFLNESDADEYIYSICCYGALLIMPISAFYALCFYDESVYKVRKKGDKILLSDDDVQALNLYTIEETDTFAFLPTEDKDKNYYLGLAGDEERLNNIKSNIELPQFRVLASASSIEKRTMRSFTSDLMDYDTKHGEEENYIDKRLEFVSQYLGIIK